MNERSVRRFERLVCCCPLRRKRIAHRTPNDSPTSFIHCGIHALTIPRSRTLIIADFGSSYGQSSIRTMKLIIDYLRKSKKLARTPLVIHNDVPNNNWTTFFQLLAANQSYCGLATGRSFYEQCLPTNSLTIGYSSASLHYLSKIPCHLSNHCYFRFASANERELFRQQSKLDLHSFFEHRSRELISGGVLMLSIPCTDENGEMGFDIYFDLIYQCARSLLTVDELRYFTLPFYLRCSSECVDVQLFHRCALQVVKIECVRLRSVIFSQHQNGEITRDQLAKSLTTLMRPGTESALKQALLINGRTNEDADEISTRLWCLYERTVKETLDSNQIHTYATYLVLKKT